MRKYRHYRMNPKDCAERHRLMTVDRKYGGFHNIYDHGKKCRDSHCPSYDEDAVDDKHMDHVDTCHGPTCQNMDAHWYLAHLSTGCSYCNEWLDRQEFEEGVEDAEYVEIDDLPDSDMMLLITASKLQEDLDYKEKKGMIPPETAHLVECVYPSSEARIKDLIWLACRRRYQTDETMATWRDETVKNLGREARMQAFKRHEEETVKKLVNTKPMYFNDSERADTINFHLQRCPRCSYYAGTYLVYAIQGAGGCCFVGQDLRDYVDDTMDGMKRRDVRAHLKVCQECQQYVDTYRQTKKRRYY